MTDQEQEKQVTKTDVVLMLPANTSLMARVRLKPEKKLELGKLVHKNLKVEDRSPREFIEIVLKEDLYRVHLTSL